jgi:hypothetical protein
MPEKLTLIAGDYDIKSRSDQIREKRLSLCRAFTAGSLFTLSSKRADVDHFRFVPTVARPASMKASIS